MKIKSCFVVCPIGEEGTETRHHSDEVYEYLIDHVCDLFGIKVVRVDKLCTTTLIIEDIYNHLKNDDLVIVDITENNPNVFFELGYRISLGKPVIIINDKDKPTKFPFDIQGTRILNYSVRIGSIEKHREELYNFIQQYVLAKEVKDHELIPPSGDNPGLYLERLSNGSISMNTKKK